MWLCVCSVTNTHPCPISYPPLSQVVILLVVWLHEVMRLKEGVVQQLSRGPAICRVFLQAFLGIRRRKKIIFITSSCSSSFAKKNHAKSKIHLMLLPSWNQSLLFRPGPLIAFCRLGQLCLDLGCLVHRRTHWSWRFACGGGSNHQGSCGSDTTGPHQTFQATMLHPKNHNKLYLLLRLRTKVVHCVFVLRLQAPQIHIQ